MNLFNKMKKVARKGWNVVKRTTKRAAVWIVGGATVAGASVSQAQTYADATNTMTQITATWTTTGTLWLGIFSFFAVLAIVGMLVAKIRGGRPR